MDEYKTLLIEPVVDKAKHQFEIKEDFLFDGQAMKILSGAIHYFRLPRASWEASLYNLKALGFNTVETYVPWNLHEPKENSFDFSGNLDIEAFLKLAQDMGLYAIVRPSPYICAEWEFGGLPAWLLETPAKLRRSDEVYLNYVRRYYAALLPRLRPLQVDQGGPVLMMQVENEYGSYGEDHDYLRALAQMMRDNGISVPFFTSDGPWPACLEAGSLLADDILATGNFGSKAQMNFEALAAFHQKYGKKWPLMCMEFWDGWFNRWDEPLVTREMDELVEAIREVIRLGSINLYMFHGGTNFGFMNGCSARGEHDLPQITSYDYGAPLDEQGNPTPKYYAIQAMLKEEFPDIRQSKPKIKKNLPERKLSCDGYAPLFKQLPHLGYHYRSRYPKTMEALGQAVGYLIYRTNFKKRNLKGSEVIRLVDGRDLAQVYVNGQHLVTQVQEGIGEAIDVPESLLKENNELLILMENQGRVNYGSKLASDTQRKGLRQGVMQDLHFILDWEHIALEMNDLDQLAWEAVDASLAVEDKEKTQPAFYRFTCDIQAGDLGDTFLDMTNFGRGIVAVNGHLLGRFDDRGPTLSLYCPAAYLNTGNNIITVFETQGRRALTLALRPEARFKEMEV